MAEKNRKNRRRIGTLDFETDPFKAGRVPRPFAAGVYFNETEKTIIWGLGCETVLADYLREMPDCDLYAHNGGKFDFFYLIPYANKGDIKIINGRIVSMQIGNVKLIDSYPLMPFPLAAYRKTKIDYKLFEENRREKHKDKIISYLIDDCRDLFNLITGFKNIVGNKLTSGRQRWRKLN